MRVAHLIWSLGVGGAQTLLTDIANIQVREGHEVGVFVVDDLVSDTIMNKFSPRVKVFFMGRVRGTKSKWPFVKLNWRLWKYRPDIIHSHAGKLNNVVFSHVPKVATIHNMTSNPVLFGKCMATFAISKSVKEDWKKKGYGVTTVIENGVSCESIKQKKEWNLQDMVHVVVLSRVSFSPKRQDLVVSALAKILDNQHKNVLQTKPKKCIVHFVGDGPDSDKLKEMVQQLHLEENVVFEGVKDRSWVYEHLCDYDLFVQASDFEGFGLTVAEACAAKLPVLISDVDGPLEIIDGGRLGMTFKKGDADDLANQLSHFIAGGYDYSLIDCAYQRVLNEYSIERTAHTYLAEYEKVLGK
mgnify:CR=1 FL=1